MDITRNGQVDHLKNSQMEILADLCDTWAGYLDTGSATLRMAGRAFRDILSHRKALRSGRIPLDYQQLLDQLRTDEDLCGVAENMGRAEVVKFDSSKLWLRFHDSVDELQTFWKKRNLEGFLARPYGNKFSVQFHRQRGAKNISL